MKVVSLGHPERGALEGPFLSERYRIGREAFHGGASMATSKRVVISVPDHLLREVDGLVAMARWNRSALIREAVRIYVEERKKRDVREQLMRGYQEMASLNLALAEEGPFFEVPALAPGRSQWDE
jgi:CopG family transcriptional regulator/antitoxin EndoAI